MKTKIDKAVLGVIPARFCSTRFRGKPLVLLGGKPIIQHVYEKAKKARLLNGLVVATDDVRIKNAVEKFGGQAVLTSVKHVSGTDRVAEVAEKLSAEIYVNIQGDEPFIKPSMIDAAVKILQSEKDADMSTLVARLENISDFLNVNVVKVVVSQDWYAMYFSRSPIPCSRDVSLNDKRLFERKVLRKQRFYKHIGLYAYRRQTLLNLANTASMPNEKIEKLEQLRALENGYKIKVAIVAGSTLGIDTPEDLKKAEKILKS